MKHYREFQERRLRAFLTEAKEKETIAKKFEKMNKGEENWSEGLKDMNNMPKPTK